MSLARALALLAPVRWSAVPDDVGAEFWRRGLEDGDTATVAKSDARVEYLAKARGGSHRYIKRVATGNPRRPWKYYYNDAAVAQKHAVGDRLNTKAGGKLDVVHVQDGKVHVEDEQGKRHELDAHELHARMFVAHVEAAERLATKTAAEWAKARGEAKGTPGEALHAALKAAGMSPESAASLARFVESRPGWTEAARRTMSDAVAHSGRKPSVVAANLRQVANAAENLRTARNAKAVTPAHVAEAVDLRLPKGKEGDNFPAVWGDLRDKLGKANARAEGLITALEHVGPEHKGLSDQARAAVADAAHHEARTMAQAFPALRNDPELAHADELAARLGAVLAKAKAPSTTGATTTVYIANKDGAPEPRQARYRVMEADDVHASHLPGESFHLNKNYPEGVQERLYHSDRAEQDKVRANATSFRPDIVHNTNPDAVNGPPLITEDGVVLGGNSRTMSMQLVHGSSKSAALKDHLAANAYQFGLTKEAVEGMKHPILVRELVGVDSKSTPKGELKDLVRRANESFTQGMDPRAMQVALAGRVDDNMLEKLGRMDPEDTLSDFLSKPASRDFVRSMQHAGIIDRRNRSQYLRTDGSLNQDGKQFVERLLVGKMIPDADLLGDVSLQHMAALSRAAPAILAAKTNGATHDLTGDLAVALRTQRDMDVRGHKTIREHLAQDEMDFDTGRLKAKPIEGNDRAMLLHQVLADHGKSPAVVAKMFRQYAKTASKEHDAQAGLFGNAPSSLASLRAAVDMHRPSKGADAGGTVDMFGKGATVYTGPKGGKYSDPEHKHHWTPSRGGAQADWVGAESAEKRAARKAGVDKAMGTWSAAAARMKASPGDRSAFQGHHDALHGLARALNLQTKDGERLADAAARWLKTQGHKVPARRSGHRPEAEAVQESLFRGRSPLAVAIFKALTTPRAGGLLELPEAYGERLWALAKGANHKYLKRVPKAGGGYRYYYRVGHGGGIDSHEHMVEGASFRHNGGHWQIKKTDGDTLHIEHDESGESKKVTRGELAGLLQGEHGKALEAHREGIRAQLTEARKNKASPKQIARLEERAKRAGAVDRPAREKPGTPPPETLSWNTSTKASPIEVGDIYKTKAGHYLVVESVEKPHYTSASDNEDFYGKYGGATWSHPAKMRPATDEEVEYYDQKQAESAKAENDHKSALSAIDTAVESAWGGMTDFEGQIPRAESLGDVPKQYFTGYGDGGHKEKWGRTGPVSVRATPDTVYMVRMGGLARSAPRDSEAGVNALKVVDAIRAAESAHSAKVKTPPVGKLIPSPFAPKPPPPAPKPPKAEAPKAEAPLKKEPPAESGDVRSKAKKMGLSLSNLGDSYAITGNTYEHKDRIRSAGGRWDGRNKEWVISHANASRLFKGSLTSALRNAIAAWQAA